MTRFNNQFAALSLDAHEPPPSTSSRASQGSRAAKKRARAAQHRAEQVLFGDEQAWQQGATAAGGGATGQAPAPVEWPAAAAPAVPPCAPRSPTPASLSMRDAPSDCSSSAASAPAAAPLQREGSLQYDDCFYTLFMPDDRHLVACDESGQELFTFEVANEAEACEPGFQAAAHELLRDLLREREREALAAAQQEQHAQQQPWPEVPGGAGSSRAAGSEQQWRQQRPSSSVASTLGSMASDVPADLVPGALSSSHSAVSAQPGAVAAHDWMQAAFDGDDEQEFEAQLRALGLLSSSPSGGSGGALRPCKHTAGRGHGTAAVAVAATDFPPLPRPSPASAAQTAGRQQAALRRRPGQPHARLVNTQRAAGVRLVHRGAELGPDVRAEDAAARWDPDLVHAELAMSGLRLVDDDIDATLLLYGDERVKESVLSRAEQQAQHEPDSAAGPTPEDMRHMMARAAAAAGGGGGGSGADGRPQAPATPVPRSQFADHSEGEAGAGSGVRQGAAAAERRGQEEEEGEALEAYGKKSLRKIVDEMKARGWRPVQSSSGGHQRFEREFPELGGWKQVYFMSCTPSDVRYIWAVRAGLARLDRAAAQKRQELAAAAAAAGAR